MQRYKTSQGPSFDTENESNDQEKEEVKSVSANAILAKVKQLQVSKIKKDVKASKKMMTVCSCGLTSKDKEYLCDPKEVPSYYVYRKGEWVSPKEKP